MAQLIGNELKRRRIEKCVETLGSYAICTQRMGFYIWAQERANKMTHLDITQ